MKRRVMIVGGGIAGLTTAYELSRTAEARERWSVEIVEMGHRWGGRLASAHNPERWGRNEEHGLHVWFGWYDNTFRLADQVWRDFERSADCPWTDVWDALRPVYHSDHGLLDEDRYIFRRAFFARNADTPGAGDIPSLDALFAALTDAPRAALSTAISVLFGTDVPNPNPGFWKMREPRRLLALTERMLRALPRGTARGKKARLSAAPRLERTVAQFHRPVIAALLSLVGDEPGRRSVVHILDMALAIVRGLCSPEHDVLADGDFDRLSEWEFSDFLSYHGLSSETLECGRFLHALYDIPFAFENGRQDSRVMEAGTALRYTFRIVFGYKHAPAYLLSAGAGETLVAPLYSLLRDRGVRFTPFHRLDRLHIDEEAGKVIALDVTRGARLTGDDYDPIIERRGFTSLRGEPDWDQLRSGDDLRERGVDFYSRFADRGESERLTWSCGERFDDIVLALPLGCVKVDGDGHSPVADWLRFYPAAQRCIDRLHLVPSVAAQVWLTEPVGQTDLAERAAVTWAPPYSVACDMTPVIEHESWSEPRPGACAYMCGPAPLQSHRMPSDDDAAFVRDWERAGEELERQRERHGDSLFGSRWTLHCEEGSSPYATQLVRANVEPWDLADLPLPGANAVRLEAADTGLENMALAGTWVRNTVNSTSVEAAVSTGIAAARALGAETQPILAETLFRKPPTQLVLRDRNVEVNDESRPVATTG